MNYIIVAIASSTIIASGAIAIISYSLFSMVKESKIFHKMDRIKSKKITNF